MEFAESPKSGQIFPVFPHISVAIDRFPTDCVAVVWRDFVFLLQQEEELEPHERTKLKRLKAVSESEEEEEGKSIPEMLNLYVTFKKIRTHFLFGGKNVQIGESRK